MLLMGTFELLRNKSTKKARSKNSLNNSDLTNTPNIGSNLLDRYELSTYFYITKKCGDSSDAALYL